MNYVKHSVVSFGPYQLDQIDLCCDSLQIGELAFPIICEHASHRVFTVTDDQMIEGMKLVFERMKVSYEKALFITFACRLEIMNAIGKTLK